MKNICVITSTRADYGILKPLIQRLYDNNKYNLSVVATGMHLSAEFGNTYVEIENDGFSISKKIDILLSSDSDASISATMGLSQISFANYFDENRPDLLIVLGDRSEIMAITSSATAMKIPIAHIHGGEITTGAIDDAFRHAITKMSLLHFTCCEVYRKRVIQLGESPNRVFNVGALGVENIMSAPLMSVDELSKSINFKLEQQKYCAVTFHPVTMEKNTEEEQVLELLKAIDTFPHLRFVISKANSDAGGRKINAILDGYAKNKDNILLTTSLGMIRYLSLLNSAAMIIGNSSSGILEGPASKIPTINIGNRQNGRIQANSVINCEPVAKDIVSAINKGLTKEFQLISKKATNPYGEGKSSKKIIAALDWFFSNNVSIQKVFYDINFEV